MTANEMVDLAGLRIERELMVSIEEYQPDLRLFSIANFDSGFEDVHSLRS